MAAPAGPTEPVECREVKFTVYVGLAGEYITETFETSETVERLRRRRGLKMTERIRMWYRERLDKKTRLEEGFGYQLMVLTFTAGEVKFDNIFDAFNWSLRPDSESVYAFWFPRGAQKGRRQQ